MPPKALIDTLEDSGFFSKFSDPENAKSRAKIAGEYQRSLNTEVGGVSTPGRIANRAILGLGQAAIGFQEIPSVVKAIIPPTREAGVQELGEFEEQKKSLAQASKGYGGGKTGAATEMIAGALPSLATGIGASTAGRAVATGIAKAQIKKGLKDSIATKSAMDALEAQIKSSTLSEAQKQANLKSARELSGEAVERLVKLSDEDFQKSFLSAVAKTGSVTGGALAGAVQSGSGTFSEAFSKYKQTMGTDDAVKEALKASMASAASTALVTAAFGATGIEAIEKSSGSIKNTLKTILREANAEGLEESVDEAYQSAIAAMTYDPDLTFGEAISNSLIAYGIGGVMGAGSQVVRQATSPFTSKPGIDPANTADGPGKYAPVDVESDVSTSDPAAPKKNQDGSDLSLPFSADQDLYSGPDFEQVFPSDPVRKVPGEGKRIREDKRREERANSPALVPYSDQGRELAPINQELPSSKIDSDAREIINLIVANTQWNDNSYIPDEALQQTLRSLVQYSSDLGLTGDEIAQVASGFNDAISRINRISGTSGRNARRQLEATLNSFLRSANRKSESPIPDTASDQEVEKRVDKMVEPYSEALRNFVSNQGGNISEDGINGIINTMKVVMRSSRGRLTSEEILTGFNSLVQDELESQSDKQNQQQDGGQKEAKKKKSGPTKSDPTQPTQQPTEVKNEEKVQQGNEGQNESEGNADGQAEEKEPSAEEKLNKSSRTGRPARAPRSPSSPKKEGKSNVGPIAEKVYKAIMNDKIQEGLVINEEDGSAKTVDKEGNTVSSVQEFTDQNEVESNGLEKELRSMTDALKSPSGITDKKYKVISLDSVPPIHAESIRPARLNIGVNSNLQPTVTVRNFKRIKYYVDEGGRARGVLTANLLDKKNKPYDAQVIAQGYKDKVLENLPEEELPAARKKILEQINNQESQYFAPLPWAYDVVMEEFDSEGKKILTQNGKINKERQYFVPHLRIYAPVGTSQKSKPNSKTDVEIGIFIPVSDKKSRREQIWKTLYTLKKDTKDSIYSDVLADTPQKVININGEQITISEGDDRRIQFPSSLASWKAVTDPKGPWEPSKFISGGGVRSGVRLAEANRAENFKNFVQIAGEELSKKFPVLSQVFDNFFNIARSKPGSGQTYYNDNKVTLGAAFSMEIFDYFAKSSGDSRSPKGYAERIEKAFSAIAWRAQRALGFIKAKDGYSIPPRSNRVKKGADPLEIYKGQIKAFINGEEYNPGSNKDIDGSIRQHQVRPLLNKDLSEDQLKNKVITIEKILASLSRISSGGVNTSADYDIDAITQFILDVADSYDFERNSKEVKRKKETSYDEIINSIPDNIEDDFGNIDAQGYGDQGTTPEELVIRKPWDRREQANSLINYYENFMDENPGTDLTFYQIAKDFAAKTDIGLISRMGIPRISTYGLFLDVPEEIRSKVPEFYKDFEEKRAGLIDELSRWDMSNTDDFEAGALASKLIDAYIAASKIGRMMRISPRDIQLAYRVDKGTNIEGWVYNVVWADGSTGRISSAKRLPIFNKPADEVGKFASIGGDATIIKFLREVEVDSPGMNLQSGEPVMEKTTFYEYLVEDFVDRTRAKKLKSILNKKGVTVFQDADELIRLASNEIDLGNIRSEYEEKLNSIRAKIQGYKSQYDELIKLGEGKNNNKINDIRRKVSELNKELSELEIPDTESVLPSDFAIISKPKKYRLLVPIAGVPENARVQSSFDDQTGAIKIEFTGGYGRSLKQNVFDENIRILPEGIGDFRNEIKTDGAKIIEEATPVTSIYGDEKLIESRYKVSDSSGREFFIHSEIPLKGDQWIPGSFKVLSESKPIFSEIDENEIQKNIREDLEEIWEQKRSASADFQELANKFAQSELWSGQLDLAKEIAKGYLPVTKTYFKAIQSGEASPPFSISYKEENEATKSKVFTGKGIYDIYEMVNDPEVGLSKDQRKLFSALVDSLGRRAEDFLQFLTVHFYQGNNGFNISGSFTAAARAASVLANANDSSNIVHEIAHSLEKFLPDKLRQKVRAERIKQIGKLSETLESASTDTDHAARYILKKITKAGPNGVSSAEFKAMVDEAVSESGVNPQDLVDLLYPVSNASEFFAAGIAGKIESKVASQAETKSFVRRFVEALINAVRSAFGINRDIWEEVLSRFKSGRVDFDLDGGMLFEENLKEYRRGLQNITVSSVKAEQQRSQINDTEDLFKSGLASDVFSINQPTVSFMVSGLKKSIPGAEEFLNDDGTIKKFERIDPGRKLSDRDKQRKEVHRKLSRVAKKTSVSYFRDITQSVEGIAATKEELSARIARHIASGHPEVADAVTLEALDHYIKYRNRLEGIIESHQKLMNYYNGDGFKKEMKDLGKSRMKMYDAQLMAIQASEVIADSINGLIESSEIVGANEANTRALKNLAKRYESVLKNSGTLSVQVTRFANKLNQDPYFSGDHFFGNNKSHHQMVRDMMRILGPDIKDDTDRVAINLLAFHEEIREAAISSAFVSEAKLDTIRKDFELVGNKVSELIGKKVHPREITKMVNELISTGGELGEAAYIFKSKLKKQIRFIEGMDEYEIAASAAKGILESESFNSLVSGLQKRVNQKLQPRLAKTSETIDLSGPETIGKKTYIPVPVDINDPTGKADAKIIITAFSFESEQEVGENWERKSVEYFNARSRINEWLKRNPNSMYASYYSDIKDKLDFLLSDAIQRPASKTTWMPWTFGIPNMGFQNMTARSAKVAKNAFKNFERAALYISRSVMQYKSRISNAVNDAAKDHFPYLSHGDARDMYEKTIWKELAASYQGGTKPLQVGDKLRNGKEVTKKDIQALRLQQELTSSVTHALNSDNQTRRPFLNKGINVSTTGGILVEDYNPSSKKKTKSYRRIVETHKGMVHRRYDHDSLIFAEKIFGRMNEVAFTSKSKIEDLDEAQMDILLSESYDPEFFLSFINDRQYQYAPNLSRDLSEKDNLEVAYKEFASFVRTTGTDKSFSDLVDFVVSRKGVTEKEAKLFILKDIYRAISPIARQIDGTRNTKLNDGTLISESASPVEIAQVMSFSSFSQSRKESIAPDFFYRYGFNNDGDFYTYANSAPSYFYNELISSLEFAIEDYKKALGEVNGLEKHYKSKGSKEGLDKAKKIMKNYIAMSRDEQNAGFYHRVDKLKRHLSELIRIKDGMVRINGGSGTDTSLPLEMPLMTEMKNFFVGKAVSSVMTATRPILEPLVTHFKKARQMIGTLGAASVIAPAMIAPLITLTKNTAKGRGIFKVFPEAFNGMKDFVTEFQIRRGLGGMFYNMVEAILNESIDREMLRRNNLAQPIDIVADQRAYKHNAWATVGKSISDPTEEFPLPVRFAYIGMAGFMGIIDQGFQKPFLDAAFPRAGDEIGNYMAMNTGMRMVNKVEEKLRKLYSHMEDTGMLFDLDDPSNPENNNILDADMFWGQTWTLFDKTKRFNEIKSFLADGGVPGLGVATAKFFAALRAAKESGGKTEDVRLFSNEQAYSIAAEFPTTLNIPTEGNRMMAQRKDKVFESMMTLLGYPLSFLNNLASEFGEQSLKKDKSYKLAKALGGRAFGYSGAAFITSTAAIASVVALGGIAETMVQFWGDFWDEMVVGEMPSAPSVIKQLMAGKPVDAAKTYLTTSVQIVPIIGPLIAGKLLTDTPVRPEFQPFKLITSSVGRLWEYGAGVAKTGDITYRADIPIETVFGPWAKVISSRMLQPGFEESLNMRRIITVSAPDDLRRAPNYGSARTSNYSRATPYGSKIMDAVLAGDKGRAKKLMTEAIEVVMKEQGITSSKARERVESQIRYMNPWGRLKTTPTFAQRKEVLNSMTDGDREYFLEAEKKMVDGLRSIGVDLNLYSKGSGGGYSSGSPFGSGFSSFRRSGRSGTGASFILGVSPKSRQESGRSSGSRMILGI